MCNNNKNIFPTYYISVVSFSLDASVVSMLFIKLSLKCVLTPHAKSWLIGKDSWCWEGLGTGGEGDDRGWDGWMASLTPWTWVWVNSGSWWWTGRPGVLRFMGSQRVGHDWATELMIIHCIIFYLMVSSIAINNHSESFHFIHKESEA